jgi:hypothetical protein
VPCYHWPYGCLYQRDIEEIEERFKHEVVFTGGLSKGDHHHGERAGFVEELGKKMNVKIYPDEEIGNSRFFTAEISASAQAILGFQMGRNIEGYIDVRPYQYIGAGALFFQDRHPNIEEVFIDGRHLVLFSDCNDFLDKYKAYAGYSDTIRKNGFKYCQEKHSYEVRVQMAIDVWRGRDVDCIQSC